MTMTTSPAARNEVSTHGATITTDTRAIPGRVVLGISIIIGSLP